jgi:hypothetical protein
MVIDVGIALRHEARRYVSRTVRVAEASLAFNRFLSFSSRSHFAWNRRVHANVGTLPHDGWSIRVRGGLTAPSDLRCAASVHAMASGRFITTSSDEPRSNNIHGCPKRHIVRALHLRILIDPTDSRRASRHRRGEWAEKMYSNAPL